MVKAQTHQLDSSFSFLPRAEHDHACHNRQPARYCAQVCVQGYLYGAGRRYAPEEHSGCVAHSRHVHDVRKYQPDREHGRQKVPARYKHQDEARDKQQGQPVCLVDLAKEKRGVRSAWPSSVLDCTHRRSCWKTVRGLGARRAGGAVRPYASPVRLARGSIPALRSLSRQGVRGLGGKRVGGRKSKPVVFPALSPREHVALQRGRARPTISAPLLPASAFFLRQAVIGTDTARQGWLLTARNAAWCCNTTSSQVIPAHAEKANTQYTPRALPPGEQSHRDCQVKGYARREEDVRCPV